MAPSAKWNNRPQSHPHRRNSRHNPTTRLHLLALVVDVRHTIYLACAAPKHRHTPGANPDTVYCVGQRPTFMYFGGQHAFSPTHCTKSNCQFLAFWTRPRGTCTVTPSHERAHANALHKCDRESELKLTLTPYISVTVSSTKITWCHGMKSASVL